MAEPSSRLYSVFDQIWDRQYGIWTKAPPPPKALGDGQDAFIAFRRRSAAANNADPFTHIELQDPHLVDFLRTCLPTEVGLFSKPASVGRSHSAQAIRNQLELSCLFRLTHNWYTSAGRLFKQRQKDHHYKRDQEDRSMLCLNSFRPSLPIRKLCAFEYG
jgi:hypothetical protein